MDVWWKRWRFRARAVSGCVDGSRLRDGMELPQRFRFGVSHLPAPTRKDAVWTWAPYLRRKLRGGLATPFCFVFCGAGGAAVAPAPARLPTDADGWLAESSNTGNPTICLRSTYLASCSLHVQYLRANLALASATSIECTGGQARNRRGVAGEQTGACLLSAISRASVDFAWVGDANCRGAWANVLVPPNERRSRGPPHLGRYGASSYLASTPMSDHESGET